MTIFSCFSELFVQSSAVLQFFWILWLLFGVVAWIFIVSFIYYAVLTDRLSQVLEKNNVFLILMITSNIVGGLHIALSLFASLFYVHYWNSDTIKPKIDYANDLNECNDIDTFDILASITFGVPSSILYDLNYFFILITYYYRLITLFKDSLFKISIVQHYMFGFEMFIFIVVAFTRSYFQYIGKIEITVPLFNIIISFILIISFHLVYNLKRQSNYLVNFILNVRISNCNNNFNNNDNNSDKHSGKVFQIVTVFNRLVSLGYVCLLTNVSVVIMSIFVYQILVRINDTFVEDVVYWTCLFLDNVINIVSISLQYEKFGYFDIIYQYCCKLYQIKTQISQPIPHVQPTTD